MGCKCGFHLSRYLTKPDFNFILSPMSSKLALSLRILDQFSESDSHYSFDKMLVPNRIFEYLMAKSETLDGVHRKNFEFLVYIVNTVYRRYQMAFNMAIKHHWSIDIDKWAVPIYSKIYDRILGSNYLDYVNILEQWGVIGRSRSYIKGTKDVPGKCKHYWFTKEFLSYVQRYLHTRAQEEAGDIAKRQGGVRVVMVTNPILYRKLAERAEEVHCEQMKLPEIKELYEDLTHFSIDEQKSHDILGEMVSNGAIPPERMTSEMNKVKLFNSYSTDKYALYCKRDAYGRVHTNITQMKKEVRKSCISCDGKPTVEIDIKSSQGAFLYRVLDRYISKFDGREHIVIFPIGGFAEAYWKVEDTWDCVDNFHKELEVYRNLLVSGSLYEFFLSYVNKTLHINVDRNKVKKEFLTCLFCGKFYSRKKHKLVGAIQKLWKEKFPNLYKAIQIIKRGHYAELAHELQRTESHLIFSIVYRRIKDELHCPVCTVHDSIIVAEEYAERAKKIFDDALTELQIPTFTEQECMEAFIEDIFIADKTLTTQI